MLELCFQLAYSAKLFTLASVKVQEFNTTKVLGLTNSFMITSYVWVFIIEKVSF